MFANISLLLLILVLPTHSLAQATCSIPIGVVELEAETPETDPCANIEEASVVQKYLCSLPKSDIVVKTRFAPNADCTKLRIAEFELSSPSDTIPPMPTDKECRDAGCGGDMHVAHLWNCCDLSVAFSEKKFEDVYCSYGDADSHEDGFAWVDLESERVVTVNWGVWGNIWREFKSQADQAFLQTRYFETPEMACTLY